MATLTNQLRWRRRAVVSSDGLSTIVCDPVQEQFWQGDLLTGEPDAWVPVPVIDETVVDDSAFPPKSAVRDDTAPQAG